MESGSHALCGWSHDCHVILECGTSSVSPFSAIGGMYYSKDVSLHIIKWF